MTQMRRPAVLLPVVIVELAPVPLRLVGPDELSRNLIATRLIKINSAGLDFTALVVLSGPDDCPDCPTV